MLVDKTKVAITRHNPTTIPHKFLKKNLVSTVCDVNSGTVWTCGKRNLVKMETSKNGICLMNSVFIQFPLLPGIVQSQKRQKQTQTPSKRLSQEKDTKRFCWQVNDGWMDRGADHTVINLPDKFNSVMVLGRLGTRCKSLSCRSIHCNARDSRNAPPCTLLLCSLLCAMLSDVICEKPSDKRIIQQARVKCHYEWR